MTLKETIGFNDVYVGVVAHKYIFRNDKSLCKISSYFNCITKIHFISPDTSEARIELLI